MAKIQAMKRYSVKVNVKHGTIGNVWDYQRILMAVQVNLITHFTVCFIYNDIIAELKDQISALNLNLNQSPVKTVDQPPANLNLSSNPSSAVKAASVTNIPPIAP